MKRTVILLIVIVLLAAGWSGGWYYVADRVDAEIVRIQDRLANQQRDFVCGERQISGFPFRISLECNAVGYVDRKAAVGITAGALKTASQVYQPGKVITELTGPANIDVPGGRGFELTWNSLRSSLALGLDGLDRFSVLGRNLALVPSDSRSDAANADELQLHGRRLASDDAEIAVRSRNVTSPEARWPGFDFDFITRFDGIFDELLEKPDLVRIGREQGLAGEIQQLDYTLAGGGTVAVSGPFSIDRNGILSGQFKLVSRQSSKLLAALRELWPDQGELLDQVEPVVKLLDGDGSKPELQVTLNVRKGNASLGIVPVGRVPPLY